jgi:hypothetical protein
MSGLMRKCREMAIWVTLSAWLASLLRSNGTPNLSAA